jgi:hypothetical protein
MPAFHPRIRAAAVGIAAMALLAVGVGGTFAASNPATLYACYNTTGQVALSDIAQCKLVGGGRLVSWSTAGVPGPTGATGATGAIGPIGPTGATGGLAGYEIVTASTDISGSFTAFGGLSVPCPAGKKAVGGGGVFLGTSGTEGAYGGAAFTSSAPSADGSQWTVTYDVDNSRQFIATIVARAACASVAP